MMLKLHSYNSLGLVLNIIVKDKIIICIFDLRNRYVIDSTQIDDLQNYKEIKTED